MCVCFFASLASLERNRKADLESTVRVFFFTSSTVGTATTASRSYPLPDGNSLSDR